MVILWQHTGI